MSHYYRDEDRGKPEPQLKWLERCFDDLFGFFIGMFVGLYRAFFPEDPPQDQQRRRRG